MAGFWNTGNPTPYADSGGMVQNYTGANGKNAASIINGKLYIYDQSQLPQDFVQQTIAAVPNTTVASGDEVSNAINQNGVGNGAGNGSMKEGLTDAALFALTAGTAGAALGGASGGLTSAAGTGLEAAEAGASPAAAAIGGQVAPAALTADAVSPAASAVADTTGNAALNTAINGAGGAVPDYAAATGPGGISSGTALSGAGLAATAAGAGGAGGTTPTDYSNTTQGLQNQGVLDANGNLIPSPGATSTGGFTGATGAGSALSRIIAGTGSAADYASVLGAGGAALLGAVGSSQQQSALNSLNQQYLDMGAPSRDRYNASFQPGFTMASDPGYTDSLNMSAKADANALSVNGNPGGSPNAWAQSLQDLQSKTAYPALQAYRNQNAATSGIGSFSAAAPATAQAAIGAGSNVYNAIGSGISSITNPQMTLSQFLAGQNSGSSIFKTS